MRYYDINLAQIDYGEDTEFLQGMDAGTQSCNVLFSWDNTLQEQYDEYVTASRISAESDPLVNTEGGYITSYDYISFYLNIDEENIQGWILSNPSLFPTSLKGLSIEQQVVVIQERINMCKEINTIISQYNDMLYWYLTITHKGETIQGKLLPGAIYTNIDGSFSLEIRTDRSSIGRNDLAYVTFRIGIE